MPRCVVDPELVARVALRRGSLWCWCPTRVYSRESECRRSCQASSTREPRRHLLSPAAISVDACGSGGEFAQDCVDGNGGGAFRASAASWRFVRRRSIRGGRRKARRPRRCRETRSAANANDQGRDGVNSSRGTSGLWVRRWDGRTTGAFVASRPAILWPGAVDKGMTCPTDGSTSAPSERSFGVTRWRARTVMVGTVTKQEYRRRPQPTMDGR